MSVDLHINAKHNDTDAMACLIPMGGAISLLVDLDDLDQWAREIDRARGILRAGADS